MGKKKSNLGKIIVFSVLGVGLLIALGAIIVTTLTAPRYDPQKEAQDYINNLDKKQEENLQMVEENAQALERAKKCLAGLKKYCDE